MRVKTVVENLTLIGERWTLFIEVQIPRSTYDRVHILSPDNLIYMQGSTLVEYCKNHRALSYYYAYYTIFTQ